MLPISAVDGEHVFVDRVLAGLTALGVDANGVQVHIDLAGAADVDRTVATWGPGDVRAIESAAVVRLEPPRGSLGFEPNLFPSIELAHPALPWLLTPSARVPWLVLVVVEDRMGITISTTPSGRVLTIAAPAQIERELPDLANAWAWVHAYGTGAQGASVDAAAFARSAGPTTARLLCPRRLAPRTRYHAALVPAYAAAVRAGLGEDPAGAGNALAWDASTPVPLRLPVFADWEFTTGEGGDFASLAKLLVPRVLDPEGAARVVDCIDPGWGIAPVADRHASIGGLLRPQGTSVEQTAAAIELGEEIADLIDSSTVTADNEPPLFAPPTYGSYASGHESRASAPAWQGAIAGDVGLRAAAGLGAEIVRRRQDELVDEAWRQLGDAEEANRTIRLGELAAAVSRRLFDRHIGALASDTDVLHVTAPAHQRTMLGAQTTVMRQIADSAIPTRAVSAAFRRQMRPGGRLAKLMGTSGARAGRSLVERTNRGLAAPDRIEVVPPKRPPHGVALFDVISNDVGLEQRFAAARSSTVAASAAHWRTRTRTPIAIAAAPVPRAREISHEPSEQPRPRPPRIPHTDPVDDLPPLPSRGVPERKTIDAFELAARRHQRYLVEHLSAVPRKGPRAPWTKLGDLRSALHANVASATSLVAAIDDRIVGAVVTGTFQPVSVTPVFERALVDDVKAIALSRLMPGIGDILQNTVAICVPDHDAIRALLVGANHELAAELAWRRYPGALDRLLLRTFWGRIVRTPGGLVRDPDVPQIDAWPDEGPPPPPIGLAVVIRGELLARYPNAIVYLVEAQWSGGFRVVGEGPQEHASVRVSLASDTAVFAFARDELSVVGGQTPSEPPGWYVVIEEAPHEPRFGLAVATSSSFLRWRDLGWDRVAAGDLHGEHLRADGPLASVALASEPGARWGADGATQAAITLRRPTRIAFHASRLLRGGS